MNWASGNHTPLGNSYTKTCIKKYSFSLQATGWSLRFSSDFSLFWHEYRNSCIWMQNFWLKRGVCKFRFSSFYIYKCASITSYLCQHTQREIRENQSVHTQHLCVQMIKFAYSIMITVKDNWAPSLYTDWLDMHVNYLKTTCQKCLS